MRIIIALVVAGLITFAATTTPAAAAASKNDKYATICERAFGVREAVIDKHGKRAPGRNICRLGVRSKYNINWTKDATTKQKAKYYRQLKKLNYEPKAPLLARTAVSPGQSPAGTLTASVKGIGPGGSSNPMVNPSCESGGNPQVVDPSGTYWGKYQFDASTWSAHGGSPGSYGSAPEAEQDRIAARVKYDAWPSC